MAASTTITGNQTYKGTKGELSNRLQLEVSDKLWSQGANMASLVQIAHIGNKESVKNSEYTILEDDHLPFVDQINAGTLTAGTTTITVDNATRWRAHDVWLNERTGEHILCTVDGSGTTVASVERGWDTDNNGTGIALLDNDVFRYLGNALDEDATMVTSLQTKVSTRTNYIQEYNQTTALTERRMHTSDYGEDEQKRQRRKTSDQFMINVENSWWFGSKVQDIEGSSPLDGTVTGTRYATDGFKQLIDSNATSTNVLDAAGSLTLMNFWDVVASINNESPDNKGDGNMPKLIAFCGQTAISVVNQWALGPIQTSPASKVFGMNLNRVTTPYGPIDLKQHLLFTGEYADYIFFVNPSQIGYRYLQGLDVKMRPIKTDSDGSHVMRDEFFGYLGFWMANPDIAGGYIKNVQFAA